MRMTPTVILVGILALLATITLTVVYLPYTTADRRPATVSQYSRCSGKASRSNQSPSNAGKADRDSNARPSDWLASRTWAAARSTSSVAARSWSCRFST